MLAYKGVLASKATSPDQARRLRDEKEDWLLAELDPFETDHSKIICSKGFRRLQGKTQVQTGRMNAHIRRRSSHSWEVLACATTIAQGLGLNVNLCRAISAGHDLGHTPFGHAGETFITKMLYDSSGLANEEFRHEVFGVIVSQFIERKGEGLNLTLQTLDGILRHSRGKKDASTDCLASEEANAVMYADKIAYLLGDYNDMFNRHLFSIDDYPELRKLLESCGYNQRHATWYFIDALCRESAEKGAVSFSECEAAQRFERFKKLMYGVYQKANLFDAENILARVHSFLDRIAGGEFNPLLALALMTDEDVLYLQNQPCLSYSSFKETSVWELLKILRDRKDLSLTDPKLDW